MYAYTWDPETGGLLLNSSPLPFSKEPRPVYYQELDILGFDKFWEYEKDDSRPYMWAEANNYIYRGQLVATVKGGSFFTPPALQVVEPPKSGEKRLIPVNINLMVERNHSIMNSLVAETIKNVYNTFLDFRNRVDIFHVSYSGGKDSEVCLDIVQRALPHNAFIVIFGDTGMEFPDTYESVQIAKQRCEQNGISFYIAKSHLQPTESWKRFGPPAATIRWCCSVHKTTPQLLLIKDIVGKPYVTEMAFVGVRADESIRRSGYDYISLGTKHQGQYSCNPILAWNSAEVYLYIYDNELNINKAYKRGNTRAGCLVCPMSTNRNDYLNNYYYKEATEPLLDIIRNLNGTDKNDKDRLKSYIENNGWKARKNGRDLTISPKDYDESVIGKKLVIVFKNHKGAWFQWLKTIGDVINGDNPNIIKMDFHGKRFILDIKRLSDEYFELQVQNDNSSIGSLFLKNLRIASRKSHYCISCRVCMSNCKYGNLIFNDDGKLSISDKCVKCGQCLNIDTGCYVYKSLWLSKGIGNMSKQNKSIDCYAAHGPKMEWFKQYVNLGSRFASENTLGNNQIPAFNRFLRDAGIIVNNIETHLGKLLRESNLEDEAIWALMLVNLTYTPEVGWYIKNFSMNEIFGQNSIVNKLSTTEGVSPSAQKSIPAALKRISALPLGSIGFGIAEKSTKDDGGTKFIRIPWASPDPKVLLYSLYKFAETCGGYYQFSLSRLYDENIDSDGVSPVRIFGIEEEKMKQLLTGLSANYGEYINAAFTLDLDNITLKDDKTAQDILNLF